MQRVHHLIREKPITEYKNEFKLHEIKTRPSFRPDGFYRALREPVQDETTNKHDYVKHSIERPQGKLKLPFTYPKIEMEKKSSYNKEFTYKHSARAIQVKHDVNEIFGEKAKLGSFDADATYKADYRPWDLIKTESYRPDRYRQADFAFDDETTYSYDFINVNQTPRSILKPDKSVRRLEEPFPSKTGYMEDYSLPRHKQKKHRELESNSSKYIPFKQDTVLYNIPNANGLYDSTTNSLDSLKWHIQPVNFNSTTNNLSNNGINSKKIKDMRTSYNLEYTKKLGQRAEQVKPAVRKRSQEKFESESTYSLDYKRHDPKPQKFNHWQQSFEELKRKKMH